MILHKRTYFFSPFRANSLTKGETPALLLQLSISDVLATRALLRQHPYPCEVYTSSGGLYPLLTGRKVPPLVRLHERLLLLDGAFPELRNKGTLLRDAVHQAIKHLCFPEDYEEFEWVLKDGESDVEKSPNRVHQIAELHQIMLLLDYYLFAMRENPHVLFFLLCRQRELCNFITREHFCEMINRLEPQGTNAVYESIHNFFLERGAVKMLPLLNKLVRNLRKLYGHAR